MKTRKKRWHDLTCGLNYKTAFRAVVVAQLIEQSLPTPEIRGSNPDIGKILSANYTIEKTKIKKKRPGMPIFKKTNYKTASTIVPRTIGVLGL